MDTLSLAHRIRLKCVEIAAKKTGCHLGGSLSCADILAVLYGHLFKENPGAQLIFSKGHAAAAYYSALWVSGRLEIDPALHYGEKESYLTGHPNRQIPDIPFATGALGHGPSLALGVALAKKLSGEKSPVFTLMGDGELQEGSCWETFQVASAKGFGNFNVIVDVNGGQNDGYVNTISPLGDLNKKFEAFGFQTLSVDGHHHPSLLAILSQLSKQQPSVVLANTKKGFGIRALAGNPRSHYASISVGQSQQWIKELENAFSA